MKKQIKNKRHAKSLSTKCLSEIIGKNANTPLEINIDNLSKANHSKYTFFF